MKYKRFIVIEGDDYDVFMPFYDEKSFSSVDSAIKCAEKSYYEKAIIFDCDEREVVNTQHYCSKCYTKRPFDNAALTSDPPKRRATCLCGNVDIY